MDVTVRPRREGRGLRIRQKIITRRPAAFRGNSASKGCGVHVALWLVHFSVVKDSPGGQSPSKIFTDYYT